MEPIVPPDIEAYCTAHSTPPSALLQELYEHTNRNCVDPQMLIGPLEAALLQALIRICGARRVLEGPVHRVLGAGDGRGAARRRQRA